MKLSEIRKLKDEELTQKVIDSKKELFELRMKQAVGNLDKPSELKRLRKDVAKMKTVLKERELQGKDEK